MRSTGSRERVVQPPFLVTKENIHSEGGDQNTFIPSNNYKQHYLEIWAVKCFVASPAGPTRRGSRHPIDRTQSRNDRSWILLIKPVRKASRRRCWQ